MSLFIKNNYRTNIIKENNLINLNICKILIKKNNYKLDNLNERLQNQTFIYKIYSKKCGSVILKLFKKKHKYINMFNNEINLMYKVKKLIDMNICPNFIYIYDYIQNKDLQIIMEYADGDTDFLFTKKNINSKLLKSYLFQIFVGILCLSKILKIFHRDIKPKNIFFKKIDESIIFNYRINNINYNVPTYGYLFIIGDFGIAKDYYSTNNLEYKKFIINNLENNTDYKKFKNHIYWLITDNVIKKYNTINLFLDILNSKDIIIIKNNFNLENPKNFNYIVKFCIENNLLNFKEFVSNYNIIEFIFNVIDDKDNIETIIYKNFKEFISESVTKYSFIIS